MKKFIRMALVLTLAGSALLYTSCTKDYSEDLSGLQKDVSALKSDYSDVKTALTNLQTQVSGLQTTDASLQSQINAANANISTALAAIETLDQYAKKGYVDGEIDALDEKLQGMIEDEVAETEAFLLGKIDEVKEDVASLVEDFPELQSALEDLEDAMALLNSMIQSITFVPTEYTAAYDVEAVQYILHTTPASNSDHIIAATFKVSPAAAVDDVTLATTKLTATETKATAGAPKALKITKIVPREDVPGYIDVYATVKAADFASGHFGMALEVLADLVDGGLKDDVSSNYVQVNINPTPQALAYTILDNKTGEPITADVFDTPVHVKVSELNDSLPIFTPGRWDVSVDIAGSPLTITEAAEIVGKPENAVKPNAGDTTYNTTTAPANVNAAKFKYTNTGANKAFNSTIKPVVAKPTLLGDTDNPAIAGVKVGAWTVYGTYEVVPDTVYVTAEPRLGDVVIDWDFHHATTAAAPVAYRDTVEAIRVADADSVAGTTATTNTVKIYNKVSGFNYDVTGADVVKENSLSVKAIIASNDLPYGKADSTYVFERNVYNATTGKVYSSSFEFVVKARPADTTIDLGTFNLEANFAAGLTQAVKPIDKAVAAHADAYKLNGVSADSIAVNTAFNASVAAGKVAKRGTTNLAATAMTLTGTTATPVKDNSVITIPAAEMGYGTYTYTEKRTVFGITYTYKATINVTKPAAVLAKKAAYVSDDEEGVAPKSFVVEIKGGADGSFNYILNDAEFADYLKVVDLKATTEPLNVAFTTVTTRANGMVTAGTTPVAVTLIPASNTGNIASSIYQWNTYDSLQFTVRAKLAPVAAPTQVLDSADVRLWTADPIPHVAAKDTTVKHLANNVASVDLAGCLDIKDFRDSTLTDNTGLITTYSASVWNYGQALAFDTNKAHWQLVSGADNINELDLTLAGSVLTLGVNQGTIVTPIVVKIPVILTYNLDQGLESKNTFFATVTFVEQN